ncbi:MAG: hypothetical protein ACJ8HQ_08130 [Chthoniobacterales bacterium]
MSRTLVAFVALVAIAGGFWFQSRHQPDASGTSSVPPSHQDRQQALSQDEILRTWGNPASLSDHFVRHGADFGARDAQEYARMAAEFLRRARAEGLSAKVSQRGDIRVYDPRSGAFGAYNPDGTTKTFFKPRSRSYFDRQPGRVIDIRTWRAR